MSQHATRSGPSDGEHPRAFDEIMQRALGEFREMPDLQLTASQAARLWSGDAELCSAVLCELVERGFLVRTRHHSFSRLG